MTVLKYEIVKSGSSGNCVIIEDVMVDCGIGFKEIRDKLYKIKYLLLTHNHSDHIKQTTLKSLKKQFPRIVIIGNYEIQSKYGVTIISNEGFDVLTKDYIFIPFDCPHDCKTQGFAWEYNNQRIIYATDTTTLKNAPDQKYDYLFIESNHDKLKLEMAGKGKYGYDAYRSGMRHLSIQNSKAFYYVNRVDKNSKWIELHKSNRFY